MKYKPLHTNVLVALLDTENENSVIVGIEDPDIPQRAEVQEIGSGNTTDGKHTPIEVRPGMIVHVFPRDGRKITLNGANYYLFDQSDLLLIEEN